MERRELLKMIALLTGGVVVGGEVFLSGCKTNTTSQKVKGLLTANDEATLNEVGNVIIPDTDSPGAKVANVGAFMNVFVSDCYTPAEQKTFTAGLKTMAEVCKTQYKKGFEEISPAEKTALLTQLEKEASMHNKQLQEKEKIGRDSAKLALKDFAGDPVHYYTMIKQLTLMGYFTSEPGMTKALRHVPVPGKYDGAYPYKKGDKAWSL